MLGSTYASNDAVLDEELTDRQVAVTGMVSRIRRVEVTDGSFGKGTTSVYMLSLDPGGATPVWFQFFGPKDRKELAALKPHLQAATVQGRCLGRTRIIADGKSEQVILFVNCELVDVKSAGYQPGQPDLPGRR
jgi:hypothetical protein